MVALITLFTYFRVWKPGKVHLDYCTSLKFCFVFLVLMNLISWAQTCRISVVWNCLALTSISNVLPDCIFSPSLLPFLLPYFHASLAPSLYSFLRGCPLAPWLHGWFGLMNSVQNSAERFTSGEKRLRSPDSAVADRTQVPAIRYARTARRQRFQEPRPW